MMLEIVKKNDDVKGFEVLSKRWIVERTLAWICRNCRLNKITRGLQIQNPGLFVS